MPDPSSSTAVDVRREAASVGVPLPPMDDGELSALWRTAKGLAESGLFKDARQAGQAFAKIIAGRDLGLTPFESMSSLHVLEGKIEAGGDLHATKVRQRSGYDFRVAWLKVAGPPVEQGGPPKVEAVWADEEALDDLRETYGCAVVFYVDVPEGGKPQDGRQHGVSRWTEADTIRAGLDRDRGSAKSNHVKFPRNMYYNRAMTNGVAWFMPEVMGGVRVYSPGELPRGAEGEDLTTAADPAAEPVKLDDLPTAVEAVIARARELGHVGLQNRAAAAMAIGGRGEYVDTWIRNATAELNRMAAGREPEPVDAEVVCAAPDPAREGVTCEREDGHDGAHRAAGQTWDVFTPDTGAVSAEEAQTPDPTPEASGGAEDAPAAPEAPDSPPTVLDDMIESCRASIRAADDEGDRAEFDRLSDELAGLIAERDAQQNPDQSSLL